MKKYILSIGLIYFFSFDINAHVSHYSKYNYLEYELFIKIYAKFGYLKVDLIIYDGRRLFAAQRLAFHLHHRFGVQLRQQRIHPAHDGPCGLGRDLLADDGREEGRKAWIALARVGRAD